MGEVGSLRVFGRAEQSAIRQIGLPARLRSLFSARKPEPRVRYGQQVLPGLAALTRVRPADVAGFVAEAERTAARRFAHGGVEVVFDGRIDWNPRGRSEEWRVALNALEPLFAVGVAAAVAETPEARRGWYEVATGLVREWIAGAPPGRGVAWRLPALARRIPQLVHLQAFFASELRADARMRRTLLASLYEQAGALAAAVAGRTGDAALVGAGRALLIAGRLFDGMEARGWLEAGAGLLWGQLREQIHEDGGHAARNPALHATVLAHYLEVLALLRAANDDVPIWARKRVKGMTDFLARLLHPDGEIPLFHGAGLGVARSARDLLAVAAVVLHEPGCALPGELGTWPLLVLGESGQRVHGNLARCARGAEARALRRTGFYVLPGAPGDVMLLDGGAPPPGGDASALGYELSVGGRRVVVDAGVAGEDAPPWPAYFRSTRAHNVVTVGGREQTAGARPLEVTDVGWVVRDGLVYFAATHDGFAGAGEGGVRHRRHVFCLPGRFWLVCDQLVGTGTVDVESFVHFHPDVSVRAACQGRVRLVASCGEGVSLQIVPAGAHEVRLLRGVDGDAPQGWYGPRPGERLAAPVVSLAAEARLPFVFGYALLPRAEAPAVLRLQHDAFHLHATLATGGEEYLLSVVQGDVEMVVRPG
ncbi:MAG TPA: alginate lyase family protein [Candidatus Binatia bacterium]|nr:alginate lyase family protein [Candidatus Binatia bacterium]